MPSLAHVGVTPSILEPLAASGITTTSSFLARPSQHISSACGMTSEYVEILKLAVADHVLFASGGAALDKIHSTGMAQIARENPSYHQPNPRLSGSCSALSLYHSLPPPLYLSTGSPALDALLCFASSSSPKIIELYGPSTSGKTAIALSMTARLLASRVSSSSPQDPGPPPPQLVHYVCCSGAAPPAPLAQRVSTLLRPLLDGSKSKREIALSALSFHQVLQPSSIFALLTSLPAEPALIIIDPVTALLAPSLAVDGFQGLTMLTQVSLMLRRAAHSLGHTVVVLTNTLSKGDMSLGEAWKVTADVRVELRTGNDDQGERLYTAKLECHSEEQAEGETAQVREENRRASCGHSALQSLSFSSVRLFAKRGVTAD